MIKNEQVAAARAAVVKAVPEISGIEVWVRGGGTAPSSLLRGDATSYDRLAANFSLLPSASPRPPAPVIYLNAGNGLSQ